MKKEYYIYLHIKLDTGEPFYIGKGKGQRATQKYGRNDRWKKLVAKYDYDIILIEEELSNQEACDLEKYWIKRIGRADLKVGPLVNMTDGGEGSPNRKTNFTTEHKEKLSISAKNRVYSKEDCEKMGVKKGNIPWNKGKKHNEKTIKLLSNLAKERIKNGFKLPSTLGIKMSDEAKIKQLNTIKKNSPPIYSVNIKTNEIINYTSIWDVIDKNKDYNKRVLYDTLRGYNNSYKGFKWYYK